MTCKFCGIRLTPFASGDCGRHPAPRPKQERIIPVTSPWVRKATDGTLPTKDLTSKF